MRKRKHKNGCFWFDETDTVLSKTASCLSLLQSQKTPHLSRHGHQDKIIRSFTIVRAESEVYVD